VEHISVDVHLRHYVDQGIKMGSQVWRWQEDVKMNLTQVCLQAVESVHLA